MSTRSVTWGDDFGLHVRRAGGMPTVANRLTEIWGATADSRATLDKLRTMDGPESMTDAERWRAYQVLVLIEQDPTDWGITDPGVPPGMVAYFHGALDGSPTSPAAQHSAKKPLRSVRSAARKSAKRRDSVYNFMATGDNLRSVA